MNLDALLRLKELAEANVEEDEHICPTDILEIIAEHNSDVVWVAMPLYGSGSRFPEGVYTSKEACEKSQLDENGYSYHRPMSLPFIINKKGVVDV